ncbi:MAG: hypothetical protein IIB57_09700 [Planctomycetes bacterium]|nr:hypothetical protein [Planctomycetota bacterium]
MDRRTKILAGMVGAGAVYFLLSAVVYPKLLKPMFTIDERVKAAGAELDEMLEFDTKVEDARLVYRRYLDRLGSFDAAKLENDVRERLNKLIGEYKLDGLTVSGGSGRLSSFGKTDAKRMILTVQATASLEGAIGFLRGIYELPHLIRVGNVSISPSRSSRTRKRKNKPSPVRLKIPIELLVLPAHRMVGKRMVDEDLHQPESLVRHDGRNYALIWERTPFTEYVKIEPLVVSAGEDLDFVVNKRNVSLKGTVTGGDGENVITWTTTDGTGEWLDKLKATNTLRPRVKTSKPFSQIFTLTVADGSENVGIAQVQVTIRPRNAQVAENKDESEPDPGPKRWKNRNKQKLVMTLISRDGDVRHDEVMVHNSMARKTSYYRPGDEFDGGELVFVHPRGAIVRRQDEYFVYPIGAKVSNDVKAKEANDYPTLRRVTALIREALGEPAWDAEAKGEEPAGESSVVTVADTQEAGKEADAVKPADSDGETVDDSQGESKDPDPAKKSSGEEIAAPTEEPPVSEPAPAKSTMPVKKEDGSTSGTSAASPDAGKTTPADSKASSAPSSKKQTPRSRASKRGSSRAAKGKRGRRSGRGSKGTRRK